MTMTSQSLGHIGDAYVSHAEQFYETDPDDLTPLLDCLPDLTLDSKYVLDDYRPREEDNSVLRLYVREKGTGPLLDNNYKKRKKESLLFVWPELRQRYRHIKKSVKIAGIPILTYRKKIKPLDPFSYIRLPFTEEAVWQAYLLQGTYHIIGMRWHGGYARRLFINLPGDIEKIKDCVDFTPSETNSHLDRLTGRCREAYSLPAVSLRGNKAVIVHCWFDAWQGLTRVTCQGEYDNENKQMGRFETTKEETLVEYKCDIRF